MQQLALSCKTVPGHFCRYTIFNCILQILDLNVLKNTSDCHKFKIWNKVVHLKKVAQLLSRSMHFATELAEFYISYNGEVLSWYTLLIG